MSVIERQQELRPTANALLTTGSAFTDEEGGLSLVTKQSSNMCHRW
ncbi:hypothetical protein [Fibrella forsythiae]|uniref:Uncharacterized protein n=1 Tax=Fibrella forsythiae TaxID=2817061 RepID=A0ABS3JPI4_9BACT|nr:hypothetical protein [Fibrella forsythiae]MBO0950837.1 hypothetical protein [Fibrella forsythiae]